MWLGCYHIFWVLKHNEYHNKPLNIITFGEELFGKQLFTFQRSNIQRILCSALIKGFALTPQHCMSLLELQFIMRSLVFLNYENLSLADLRKLSQFSLIPSAISINWKENNGAPFPYTSSGSEYQEKWRICSALFHFSTRKGPLHLLAGRIDWSYWLSTQWCPVVRYIPLQFCHSHVSSLFTFCWMFMHKLLLLSYFCSCRLLNWITELCDPLF